MSIDHITLACLSWGEFRKTLAEGVSSSGVTFSPSSSIAPGTHDRELPIGRPRFGILQP